MTIPADEFFAYLDHFLDCRVKGDVPKLLRISFCEKGDVGSKMI